jgi:hypothetical protein
VGTARILVAVSVPERASYRLHVFSVQSR